MRRFTRLHCWILALLLVTPLPLAAQEPGKVRRIGLFHVGLDHVPPSLEPLREGLKALGYEAEVAAHNVSVVPAGKRLVIEYVSLLGELPAGQRMVVLLPDAGW